MKISGLKYKMLLFFMTIILAAADVFLILHYGFDEQLLIFIYVIIGSFPLCGFIALCLNIFIPKIKIDNKTKTITSDFVANELYEGDKSLKNQGDIFYFDEIINCEIDKNKLNITLIYGQTKTLYLTYFTKKQIAKIKREIDKIIEKNSPSDILVNSEQLIVYS